MYVSLPDKRASDRGLSTSLWKDIEAIGVNDPRYGMFWMDDFLQGDASISATGTLRTGAGIYTCTEVTSGTVSVDGSLGEDGYLVTNPGASTEGQGYTIQGGPKVLPAAGKIICMEARLKTSIIAPQFLFGLTDDAAAAVTGGATVVVDTTNVTDAVAFTNILSNATAASLYPYNDEAGETAVQGATAIGTLVAGTFIKLGIRITGLSKAEYFVNGALVSTYVAGSGSNGSIPSVVLQSILVAQADGSQPVTTVDWLAVGVNPRSS